MNQLVLTEDGSHTVLSERFGEHYHSVHGAIQESRHVFIDAGLKACKSNNISILEVGFGTGLNALLSFIEGEGARRQIKYTTLELYPLGHDEIKKINHPEILGCKEEFYRMHDGAWGSWNEMSKSFHLLKVRDDLKTVDLKGNFDMIYFDAFSPEAQPELWSEEIFEKIARSTNPGGVITTYSAKGAVRRALESVGFDVERISGPPGKREMLRGRMK